MIICTPPIHAAAVLWRRRMVRKAAGGCTTTRKSITTIQDRFVGDGGGDFLLSVTVPGASGNERRKAAAGRGVIPTFMLLEASSFVAVTFTNTEWHHIGVVVGVVEVAHCFCFIINACSVQACKEQGSKLARSCVTSS